LIAGVGCFYSLQRDAMSAINGLASPVRDPEIHSRAIAFTVAAVVQPRLSLPDTYEGVLAG